MRSPTRVLCICVLAVLATGAYAEDGCPDGQGMEHNCDRCGQEGPCVFGKCTGGCKKCCVPKPKAPACPPGQVYSHNCPKCGQKDCFAGVCTGGCKQCCHEPADKCECGCLVRESDSNSRCLVCKPTAQCKVADAADKVCSCPTGHITRKWTRQKEIKDNFCADQKCGPGSCCGHVAFGEQTGGDEALQLVGQSALACVSCTAGCGACAAGTAAALMKEELLKQVAGIVRMLQETSADLGSKATEFGSDMTQQLTKAMRVIVDDIVKYGTIQKGNQAIGGGNRAIDFGACKLVVEPGMATYSSSTCFCVGKVQNMNAVQPYLAWRLDCSRDAAKKPKPPTEQTLSECPAGQVKSHNCDKCGQDGPCLMGKCTGGCRKCCHN